MTSPKVKSFTRAQVAKMVPYITTWVGNGFLTEPDVDRLSVPGTRTAVAINIRRFHFQKYCTFEYVDIKLAGNEKLPPLDINGRIWWEAGMQAWITEEVQLVSDDSESVFIFYNLCNNPTHPMWLGRLTPGHASTKLILKRMRNYCNGRKPHI